jgi:hypothetical protein
MAVAAVGIEGRRRFLGRQRVGRSMLTKEDATLESRSFRFRRMLEQACG